MYSKSKEGGRLSLHKSLYGFTMVSLQIDFSRILCSHEHFVALNLPSHNPQQQLLSEPGNFYSGASSPTLSVRSTDSQSSFVSHGMYQTTDTINRSYYWKAYDTQKAILLV